MNDLVRGISCIMPGGISALDFAVVAGIDQIMARSILEELVANGTGTRDGDKFNFSESDRLKAAIYALEKGAELDDVAARISWRDFEGLTAEILTAKGFTTVKNLRFKDPRMEIDVVGTKLGVSMLIDCKHWKRSSGSALRDAVSKQIRRTTRYVASRDAEMAVPAIVTLYEDGIRFIERVPIVPIVQFEAFVDEFYGNVDEMRRIE